MLKINNQTLFALRSESETCTAGEPNNTIMITGSVYLTGEKVLK